MFMKKEEAIQLVLKKKVTAIGARTISLVDNPSGDVYEDVFLNLSDQDYNPQIVEGDLVLDLWFADYQIPDTPPEAVLETRVENRLFGLVKTHKVRVKVVFDRVNVEYHRFYIEEK